MMNIAEKIIRAKADYDAVYESGQENGKEQFAPINAELEKCLVGEAVVGKTWYDEFWDNYQDYGNRESYSRAFGQFYWNDTIFKPKYDMRPTTCAYMFAYSSITDVVATLEACGVNLDTSKATSFDAFASYAGGGRLKHFPVLSTVSADKIDNMFYNAAGVETVEKLILREDGTQNIGGTTFAYDVNLRDIIIEGTIGTNVNVQWSTKLSHDSIESIINALSTTTTGLTVTFSKTAVNTAFETAEGLTDGTSSDEWEALIATKPNWTISLV